MQEDFKKVSPDIVSSKDREIKFKGRHKKRKEMYDCVWLSLPMNGKYTFGHFLREDGEVEEIESNDIILIQYTGKNDINGIEIYDGYILEFEGKIYEIRYSDDFCRYEGIRDQKIKHTNDSRQNFGLFCINKKGAILGNIYQNPELLSEK